jgi:hypothetical protein
MNSLYFWKTWNRPHKQIYFFLLSIFVLVLIALAYSSYKGIEGAVKWEVETELEPVKVVIDQFAKNLFNFTVESESYYALDKYVATEVQVNTAYSYIYLSVVILAVLFLLTTISYLELYWFMGGMLAFLFFVISLKIEMLQLFGRVDRLPLTMVAMFLLYGSICFAFNAYYKSASYLLRLLTFIILTGIIAFIIYKYSAVATPFLYLANFGSLFPIMISLIFLLIVGYDIIKGFLYVVSSTGSAGSKRPILNFVFASLLYLVNVFLLLMKKLYIFQLDIIYINPFLLLVISSILGIWMFRKRSEMFSVALPFTPAGAYVYLSLAIITLSGAAYAFINGNIGMIEAYERIIVYGHLFIGFVFLVYVLVNFIPLFDKKISVYEIVYQPVRLTFLAVPAIAITICVIFFMYQRKYPYHLALSGYYTYAGDVMTYEGQYSLAFQYYKEAVSYDYPNHRANYSIASLSAYLEDKETAKGYFENALYRDPTIQSYIGLSNVYAETGELFQALFQIQEGLKKFPGDGRLQNNLGVLFHKSNLADSSIHYFFKAKQSLNDKEVASSNVLYLLAKTKLFDMADSILQKENYPKHLSFLNNKLAILNQLGKRSSVAFDPYLVKDTTLNANTYAYLVNSNINALKDSSAEISKKIDDVKNRTSNERFKDALICQTALKKYYSGNRFEAFQDLILLNAITNKAVEYSTLLGYWMLEEDQYTAASDYFKEASKGGNANTQINYVLSSALSGQSEEALFVIGQLKFSPDKNISSIAEKLLAIMMIKNPADAFVLPEAERLQYFLLNISKLSSDPRNKLFNSFANEQAKVFAAAALCRYYIEINDQAKAIELFSSIENTQQLNTYAEREKNFTQLLLKTSVKDEKFLAEKSFTLPLNSDKELLRNNFIAASYELNGDSLNAVNYYLKSLNAAPYSDLAVSWATAYLSSHNQQQKTYDYIVDIVQNAPTVSMRKIYLSLCLDMSLVSYAESMLNELKGQISEADYLSFKERLNQIENQ